MAEVPSAVERLGRPRPPRAAAPRRGEVCLVGVGKLVAACDAAADLLGDAGVRATVWDARSVVPLDPDLLGDAAAHPLVVTVEDGIVDGGFGSRVRDALALSGSHVVACGVPTAYLPHGDAAALLATLGLDAAGVARTVLAALDGPGGPEVATRPSR